MTKKTSRKARRDLVDLSRRGLRLLWYMFCNPGMQWDRADWFRPENPTGEVNSARVHQMVDRLVETRPIKTLNPQTRAVEETTQAVFNPAKVRMTVSMLNHIREAMDHYRAAKDRDLLPIDYVELDAGLDNDLARLHEDDEFEIIEGDEGDVAVDEG